MDATDWMIVSGLLAGVVAFLTLRHGILEARYDQERARLLSTIADARRDAIVAALHPTDHARWPDCFRCGAPRRQHVNGSHPERGIGGCQHTGCVGYRA